MRTASPSRPTRSTRWQIAEDREYQERSRLAELRDVAASDLIATPYEVHRARCRASTATERASIRTGVGRCRWSPARRWNATAMRKRPPVGPSKTTPDAIPSRPAWDLEYWSWRGPAQPSGSAGRSAMPRATDRQQCRHRAPGRPNSQLVMPEAPGDLANETPARSRYVLYDSRLRRRKDSLEADHSDRRGFGRMST